MTITEKAIHVLYQCRSCEDIQRDPSRKCSFCGGVSLVPISEVHARSVRAYRVRHQEQIEDASSYEQAPKARGRDIQREVMVK